METGGLITVLKLQQKLQQISMANSRNEHFADCETLTLSLKEYSSARINENEIVYKGELYDVESSLIGNQNVTLTVIKDLKEKHIVELIKYHAQKSKSKRRHITCKLFQLTFICSSSTDIFSVEKPILILANSGTGKISFQVSEVLSPPPDRI